MVDNRIRLQKFLADSGKCSRRKAEEHIENGEVKVNGRTAIIGQKVDPKRDIVDFLGEKVDTTFRKRDEKVYILLNKPAGYVTTMKDEKDRKTVVDIVKIDRRIVPVGRLDINTSGALLLSNDGDFIYELTHPKHEITKTYTAIVKGLITYEEVEMLEKGVEIEDGMTKPAKVEVLYVDEISDTSKIEIKIHEGKNRQIRKMCDAVGHEVKKLDRKQIGDLGIKNLGLGKWRYLTKIEIEKLGYEKAVVKEEREKGFKKKEFGKKEYGKKEFDKKEFSKKEFDKKEFSKKEFSKKEFGKKEFDKKRVNNTGTTNRFEKKNYDNKNNFKNKGGKKNYGKR